jgi:hypothetical protein
MSQDTVGALLQLFTGGPDQKENRRDGPVPTPSQESLKITQEDLFFKVLKQTSEFRIVRFFFF